MDATHTTVRQFEANLPANLSPFTDIYFTWSQEAAEHNNRNPQVTKVIHAGPDGVADVAGLEETAAVYDAMTTDAVTIYATQKDMFDDRAPLMLVEGPVQELFEPETVALGTLSYHLTDANQDLGYTHPTPEEYGDGVRRITEMLADLSKAVGEDIGLADFGARHDHPARQPALAQAAYKNGAVAHSTPAGVDAINRLDMVDEALEPGGTMNHAYVLAEAAEHGLDDATVEAFRSYDALFDDRPTPVLIDTANAEKQDMIRVCRYLEERDGDDFELVMRMDTNSANYAETIPPGERVPGNKGMSVAAVTGMADLLRGHGYRDNVTFFISSGMGKTEKLERFVDAAQEYYERTGTLLFDGVGAGSFDTTNRLYTTSDIVKAEGAWLGKVGRLDELKQHVDGDLDTYKQEHMEQVV